MKNSVKYKEIPNRIPVETLDKFKIDEILTSRYAKKVRSSAEREIGFFLTYSQYKKKNLC